MPVNLNALIRYRTIDKCLSNPYRKWTIGDLMEACSRALEDSRGIYTGISERTIREDIRVMRSDILGFNAPIVQKDGNYTYGDRDYSIFNVTIKESGLLARVLDFILEIRTEIDHPELEKIIASITEVISETQHLEESGPRMGAPLSKAMEISDLDEFEVIEPAMKYTPEDLTWAGILKLIR